MFPNEKPSQMKKTKKHHRRMKSSDLVDKYKMSVHSTHS